MQAVDTLNRDRAGSLTLDLCAHLAQAIHQINDFRFTGGIAQDRRSLGKRRGHDRVFRGPDGGELHRDLRPLQSTGRFGMQVSVAQFHPRPHRLQRRDVQIHRSRPDGATTGQGDHRMAMPRQQRPQHKIGSPHLPHDIVIGNVIVGTVARHRDHLALLHGGNFCSQRFQQRRHRTDIREPRRIGQRQRLVAQKRRGHQCKTGVLRA